MKWIVAAGLAVAAVTIAYAWYRGGEEPPGRGEELVLGERRHHLLPAKRENAPLLVLLHGRGGTPRELLWPELLDALDAEGASAPAVLLVDGGEHSYFHDRRDFAWGTHVLREAIPAARRVLGTDAGREAIGGFSMGGFGALDLGVVRGDFCAIGAHSPALWRDGAETPEGAFDDANDFEQHDILELATEQGGRLFRGARVWLDVGDQDPFRGTTVELGRLTGNRVRIWPGDHSTRYWREHVDEYIRFYTGSLTECP